VVLVSKIADESRPSSISRRPDHSVLVPVRDGKIFAEDTARQAKPRGPSQPVPYYPRHRPEGPQDGVDVVGIDPDKLRTSDPSLERMLTKSNSSRSPTPNPSTMAKLSSWGKPIALTEWGVVTNDRYTGAAISSTTRAAWIKAGYAWMKSWNATHPVKIEAAMYFHVRPNGGSYLTGAALSAFGSVTP
jgi:hypothetical protein